MHASNIESRNHGRAEDCAKQFAGRTIAVTGAGGAIGRRLTPWLVARGASVVAVGRDPARLSSHLAGVETCSWDDFHRRIRRGDVDAIVDLAVINSNAAAGIDEFRSANVDRVRDLASAARDTGVRCIVAISSFHAADPDNRTAYASSKRALEEWAQSDEGGICRVVILPKIVFESGSGWRGFVWRGLASAKPAAFFDDAAQAIGAALQVEALPDRRIWVQSRGDHAGYAFVSRMVDLTFAILVLALLGWTMIVIATLVRIDSRGPAIFRQQRVGRGESLFVLYKFRTMALGTRQAGTHELGASSITRLGKFLRRTKLDELPQAWNILRGELALVGPRPCLPVQDELVAERRVHGVFSMRPGLTGLAQVNGIDMSDPRELVRWEVTYMRIRGLLLDLRIVWQTFVGRGGGDRVRQ